MLAARWTALPFSMILAILALQWSPARADVYDDAERDSRINLASQQANAALVKGDIEDWIEVEGRTCSGLSGAETLVQKMKSSSDRAYILQNSPDISTSSRERYRNADIAGTPIFISTYLDLADAYLLGGCFKEANIIYRDVIHTYTGSSYAAFRERAAIGVDDVRAGQGSAK